MQEHYTPKGKHLTIAERYFIEKWKSEGKSNRTIAGLLGKAPQTIHNEVKRGLVRQQIRRGKFEMVYQADYAQDSYEMKRRKSVRSVGLDKDTKDKILHYMKQNFSPEMMVRTKGVAVPISTIYYWIHQGHLGIDSDWMLYPRKKRGKRKKASPRFKPAGQSIENDLMLSIVDLKMGIMKLILSF